MSAATVFCRNTPVSDQMHKILGGGDANQLFSRVQFDLPKLKLVAAVSFCFICLLSYEKAAVNLAQRTIYTQDNPCCGHDVIQSH